MGLDWSLVCGTFVYKTNDLCVLFIAITAAITRTEIV